MRRTIPRMPACRRERCRVEMNLGAILGKLRRKLMPSVADKRPFVRYAESYQQRLADWGSCPRQAPKGSHVGVIVTPWMFTAVPFFSLECALLLRSEGVAVTI